MEAKQITAGTRVSYQYHQHHLLGGALVSGEGVVIDWTLVGTDRAYVIKPDAGDVVHVKHHNVQRLRQSVPA